MLTLHCNAVIREALGGIIYPMIIEVANEAETRAFAEQLGRALRGGETIELAGDVGAGKTTFVKGLAGGLDIDEDVQSPSFTISRVYDGRDGLRLVHYDFYRLSDPGIMANELIETVGDPSAITVVEWADIVEGVLPENRLTIRFSAPSESARVLELSGREDLYAPAA